jgi:hypothetical protein
VAKELCKDLATRLLADLAPELLANGATESLADMATEKLADMTPELLGGWPLLFIGGVEDELFRGWLGLLLAEADPVLVATATPPPYPLEMLAKAVVEGVRPRRGGGACISRWGMGRPRSRD